MQKLYKKHGIKRQMEDNWKGSPGHSFNSRNKAYRFSRDLSFKANMGHMGQGLFEHMCDCGHKSMNEECQIGESVCPWKKCECRKLFTLFITRIKRQWKSLGLFSGGGHRVRNKEKVILYRSTFSMGKTSRLESTPVTARG